ncbi:GIY-YIG nuclease family protein [Stenotrophomonas maltophilia]|uniref:GIY-YIG nuclease family protein n=1 Tax=Stenotrophomonas maltophilia TaxID=40324 RepID=UPI002895D285|nr:GIY-YIG nuclease family protein [Stenotrophomonas maltophilia]MDT3473853.1 GIY-YIG nuclease family protein [Stenotrophomonas maltophilia]
MKLPAGVGFVYVLEAESRVKVGVSKTPADRIRSIENATGFRASRTFVSCMHEDAASTEKSAHELLKQHRIAGEWFRCSFEEACAVVNDLASLKGDISVDRIDELQRHERQRADLASKALKSALLGGSPNVSEYEQSSEKMMALLQTGRDLADGCLIDADAGDDPIEIMGSAILELLGYPSKISADEADDMVKTYSFCLALFRRAILNRQTTPVTH